MSGATEIGALLAGRSFIVAYQPLHSEVDFSLLLALPEGIQMHIIPPRAALNPLEEAKKAVEAAGGQFTAILIPGRTFDAAGTRHGQGGGWYDKFLAHVPREWTRIGLCYDDQFSSTPLTRESWDQPMDYVIVVNRNSSDCTLYSAEGAHS